MANLNLKAPSFDTKDTTIGECHLLVYDNSNFSASNLRVDIAKLIDEKPFVGRIYIAAPQQKSTTLLETICDHLRTDQGIENSSQPYTRIAEMFLRNFVYIITCSRVESSSTASKLRFDQTLIDENFIVKNKSESTALPEVLISAWLFDAFDAQKGLVYAPEGVHFGKTSGKHSEVFLRAANVFSKSAFCRICAYFLLPHLSGQYRRLLVDTAPLISVGLALIEIARIHGIVIEQGTVESFSSYVGVNSGFEFRASDIILISASTSGGLVKDLERRGVVPGKTACITLFYLQARDFPVTEGAVLADLTFKKGQNFGYAKIASHRHDSCPWCDAGKLLAEFEGDQFLLQKRRTLPILLGIKSQSNKSQKFFEETCRLQAISVDTRMTIRGSRSDLVFNIDLMFKNSAYIRDRIQFHFLRSIPTPLNVIAYVSDFDWIKFSDWTGSKLSIQNTNDINKPLLVSIKNLSTIAKIENGGALAVFPVINNDVDLRETNRIFRSVASKGNIGYFSALHLCNSPEQRHDLGIFLQYGEYGPSTFNFQSAFSLLVPHKNEDTSWNRELEVLNSLSSQLGRDCSPVISKRILELENCSLKYEKLFLPSQSGELQIARDFVFLDTQKKIDDISQADIYALISNLIACTRNANRDASDPVKRGDNPPSENSRSVYGQELFDPKNFHDFNDGILHAAFLRSCSASYLAYSTDFSFSEKMLDVISTEIEKWRHGDGQALGEFVIAIASKRLKETLIKSTPKAIKTL